MTTEENNSRFTKEFLRVIAGARTVEDFTRGMVQGAVSDLIDKVCDEYCLDVKEVREKYEKDLVAQYSSITGEGSGPTFCEGKTVTGKQCQRAATRGKFCKTHADQKEAEKRTQRSLEEYKDRLSKMPRPPLQPSSFSQQILTQLDERGSFY